MASLGAGIIPPTCKQWHVAQSNCQNRHASYELTESAFSHLSLSLLLRFSYFFSARKRKKRVAPVDKVLLCGYMLCVPVVFALIKQTKYIVIVSFI